MEKSDIMEVIRQADLVLVGLGKEFDGERELSRNEEHAKGTEMLKREGLHWLIPGWNDACLGKGEDCAVEKALEKLVCLLQDKNYFVVSVSTNAKIAGLPWKNGKFVMPCGSAAKKQCANGCEGVLQESSEEDGEKLKLLYGELRKGIRPSGGEGLLGRCPKCGGSLIFNSIYASNYNEEGYLRQWETYMKWLQGTLNRRLAVLELGVGMDFPSVIRWPFEKAAFFNKQAHFFRVNETLYQLTEELAGKGCGISQNAIDWLGQL